jgi:alkylhydroperoxidase family enzyme
MAWQMRPRPRRPESPPQPNDGPCAEIVAALGDSPTAGLLRRTIDEAWASPVLPRRTKALLLAVIARAAGCAYSEAEARRLLAPEGLGRAEVDDILTNLGSPRLEPREVRLVPFARETVHYQPAIIQRRMREIAQGLGSDEVLELVGVLALANAICRVSVLVEPVQVPPRA